ncbi:hypothetical protein [Demequina sediminis]|nr:hypothetical protein [Demequina sediminis]
MPTAHSHLIDLAGVARLAGVQRPVASMWRTRFATARDPFPAAVHQMGGRPQFAVQQVAEWLVRTRHGNNPAAREDAAAAATPTDFSFSDEGAVAELEALVALFALSEDLHGPGSHKLEEVAATIDPRDGLLRSEITAHVRRGAPWLDYAILLIDACYSPSAALALIAQRSAASNRSAGSAGPLVNDALALVMEATRALMAPDATVVLDPSDPALSSTMAASLGDDVRLTLPAEADARRVRRRLRVDGHWLADPDDATARGIAVARVPSRRDDDVAAMLQAVDEVALSLRDSDAAVVIGPARVLTDPLTSEDEQARAHILRSGRVRGIVRLPPGLVDSASREPLAMWVLGTPAGNVPASERFTAVADLSQNPLTPAARADLVSDVIAGMGSGRDVRAHHFRFATFVRTASLQARSDSLVAAASRKRPFAPNDVADLPALLDIAAEAVRDDVAPIPIAPDSHAAPRAASVSELIGARHLRRIRGTRLSPDLLGREGLVVVTASDLDHPSTIGTTRVDQLAFAAQHPSATLTRPGDVIFRTSPTAAAWVDADGSKVVAYPARVLRITASDPGGLVPEIVAADIASAPGGAGAWKRWMLRRVAPHTVAPLRQALAEVANARSELEARAARLEEYSALIVAGATSGAVTMIETNHAAAAASTQ